MPYSVTMRNVNFQPIKTPFSKPLISAKKTIKKANKKTA